MSYWWDGPLLLLLVPWKTGCRPKVFTELENSIRFSQPFTNEFIIVFGGNFHVCSSKDGDEVMNNSVTLCPTYTQKFIKPDSVYLICFCADWFVHGIFAKWSVMNKVHWKSWPSFALQLFLVRQILYASSSFALKHAPHKHTNIERELNYSTLRNES